MPGAAPDRHGFLSDILADDHDGPQKYGTAGLIPAFIIDPHFALATGKPQFSTPSIPGKYVIINHHRAVTPYLNNDRFFTSSIYRWSYIQQYNTAFSECQNP
jgi:hypothetical protein